MLSDLLLKNSSNHGFTTQPVWRHIVSFCFACWKRVYMNQTRRFAKQFLLFPLYSRPDELNYACENPQNTLNSTVKPLSSNHHQQDDTNSSSVFLSNAGTLSLFSPPHPPVWRSWQPLLRKHTRCCVSPLKWLLHSVLLTRLTDMLLLAPLCVFIQQ